MPYPILPIYIKLEVYLINQAHWRGQHTAPAPIGMQGTEIPVDLRYKARLPSAWLLIYEIKYQGPGRTLPRDHDGPANSVFYYDSTCANYSKLAYSVSLYPQFPTHLLSATKSCIWSRVNRTITCNRIVKNVRGTSASWVIIPPLPPFYYVEIHIHNHLLPLHPKYTSLQLLECIRTSVEQLWWTAKNESRLLASSVEGGSGNVTEASHDAPRA